MQLSASFLKRNNPLEAIASNIVSSIQYLLTFNSQMKLMRFRFMLYQQQMLSIENNVAAGSPYQQMGHKINKAY